MSPHFGHEKASLQFPKERLACASTAQQFDVAITTLHTGILAYRSTKSLSHFRSKLRALGLLASELLMREAIGFSSRVWMLLQSKSSRPASKANDNVILQLWYTASV